MPEHDVGMEWNPDKLADRRIRVFVDNFPEAMLWDSLGRSQEPEALPLSDALRADLRAWTQRYNEADRQTGFIHPEMDPAFDVDAYNAEGDALCARLQGELGQDWAIEHVPLQRMVPTGQC